MNASAALASHIGAGSGAGRILAIDYGQKRLGLALSDPLRVTAQPFATWRRSNRRRDLARLRDLCREQEVGLILVGLPMHLEGTSSAMAAEASRFAELVRAEVGKPVELVDERLSSWEAEQALGENRLGEFPFSRAQKAQAGRSSRCRDFARLPADQENRRLGAQDQPCCERSPFWFWWPCF